MLYCTVPFHSWPEGHAFITNILEILMNLGSFLGYRTNHYLQNMQITVLKHEPVLSRAGTGAILINSNPL